MTNQTRCAWVSSDPLYIDYHDQEWGIPQHDEQKLFELLILEGFQSGLSWITILRKREDFREAIDQFNYQKIAQWEDHRFEECLSNPKIIRNRLKINALKMNAQAFIKIQEKFGSFDRYIWEFVGFTPIKSHFFSHQELPSSTEISLAMSKSLKKHGFKFVGPTICYSFMQAAGLVNDHITECFCYQKI